MATNGTPHEGTDNILIDAYTGLQIILYTNAFGSLSRDTVLADLAQPSALDDASLDNGYGFISLTGVWSSTLSVITYPDNVLFTNSGTLGSWDTARGSAITDGTFVLHFADFDTQVALPLGASLEIDISSVVNP